MLEGISPSSRDLPNACGQERNWMFDGFSLMETSNYKRKSEYGDDNKLGNSIKLLKINKAGDMEIDFLNLSLSLVVDPSDSIDNGREMSDTSSLIHQIGRDNSIDCVARCSRSDYGSIALVNRNFRSLIEGKELYKLRRQMGIVEHWIYFSCSLLEWEVFDPIRLRWKHLPIMPSNDCFRHSDKESLAVGTELLLFGKGITSHLIYKYSLLTNTWSTGMEMNTPRCLFGSASLGEIAIVAGGCDFWGNVFSLAELYNSDTGMWTTLPSMNKARKKCSAVFMDGKFYVIGGIGVDNSNPLTCGEVFDLERLTWTEIPDMFPLRIVEPGAPGASAMSEAPPLVTVVNNELYTADYARKEIRKYNKSSNSWATVGSLPERVVSMHGWGLAFRGCGDKLIVVGGPRGLEGGYIEVNSWAPSESPQQWTVLGRKPGGFVYNCTIMGC
ncbi:hypothetical protein SOVF_171060 [Spinacia oleracea]|uniref:F-box/kelch-repeat protein At1g74510-like n=1 Tax=Spinacia oleracea TaxID=3562 RepID=A0A9R0J4Y8_SPIOL|nr:F-box/kelch-repeat protein At1g74510-like [Spinacia oleracea]XP_021860105.1 F-box/kelch-repeat protein At1g74510-like [Spinacia oleracea]KNA07505.1 hypothetical protein SOVF_171060 [Spinacia oleracea]